jgi:hypothetical protein
LKDETAMDDVFFHRRERDRPTAFRPLSRRQPGQPPSGALAGISEPHFGQILVALIIAGGSLTRSLSFTA